MLIDDVKSFLEDLSSHTLQEIMFSEGINSSDLDINCESDILESMKKYNLSSFQNEKKVGGGEGDGETRYTIQSFSREGEKDVFIKFDGHYQSYHGSEYQEYFQVFPRQVLVTEYHRTEE